MNKQVSKFDRIMGRTATKLNFARNTLKGPHDRFRNEQGYQYTASRILTSMENFLDLGSNSKFLINEAIANGIQKNFSMQKKNFSASDMAAVMDVDVADISIGATVASHGITYIAMERAMDAVGVNVSFQGLKAINSAAGFSTGEKVIDPRTAIPPRIDVSRNGARNTTNVVGPAADQPITVPLSPAGPVVKGETKVFAVLTANINTDKPRLIAFATGKSDSVEGNIETLVLTTGGFIDGATINLVTGEFQATSVTALGDYTIIIDRCFDRIAEQDGANTLKLKPFIDSKEIVATENRIILQVSVEVQAQMNKILRKNANYGIDVDYGKRAIDQIVMLYTYFLDLAVVRELWNGAKNLPITATVDLSEFGEDFKGFSGTKNDRISLFTRTLVSDFLNRTGSPVTALVVDEIGALMYASDSENFKIDPAFVQRRDGLIGTYQEIPVVRNAFLDGKGSKAGNGVVLGVHKSADGAAGPVALGDYLPPYSTLPALNHNNPGELSQALFSQNAVKCVVPEFIIRGEITPYKLIQA